MFELSEGQTPFPAEKIESFKAYLEKVRNFLLNDGSRVLIIHAPGGYGKTHFLKEISSFSYEIDSDRQVWLGRLGIRDIKDALQDEIVKNKKYLLIFDDVDRNLADVIPLLEFVRTGDVNIKLILSLRSSGIFLLHRKIEDIRLSEITEEFQINQWKKEELIELLKMVLETTKIRDEKAEEIAIYYPNPFLIVWIGKQLEGKLVKDLSNLKKKFVDDVLSDSRKALRGVLEEDKVEGFILILASIVPFSLYNQSILEKIKEEVRVDLRTLNESIKRLLAGGILRKVGRSVRFNPDMKGEIYLAYKLQKIDKETLKNLVLKFWAISPENIFTNIGAASRYEKLNIVEELLKEFLQEWMDKADKTSFWDRKTVLSLLEKVVYIAPEEIFLLIQTYLETPMEDTKEQFLTTDDYGPIILQLVKMPKFRKEVISLIEEIQDLRISGTYDTYKPVALMKHCVSPLENNIDVILSTLGVLEIWIDKPSDTRNKLLQTALSEVLSGTHQYIRSYLNKIELGEKALKKSPEVIIMRERALNIVTKMLSSQNIDLQLTALEVAENIGRSVMGRVSEKDLPLYERFKEEREILVKEIGKLIKQDADWALLSKIEDLFIKWWGQQREGTDGVAKYLRDFPKSPEYVIFRYFASRYWYIGDFKVIEKKQPGEKRWRWFIDNIISKEWATSPEDFFEVVNELDKKYSNDEKTKEFLILLDKKMSLWGNLWKPPVFLSQWIKIAPQKFRKIRDDTKLWKQIPERFKNEIDVTLVEFDQGHLEEIAKEVINSLPNTSIQKTNTFLWLIEKHLPSNWEKWIEELIKRGNSQIRVAIVYSLCSIFKKTGNIEEILDFLIKILSKEKKLCSLMIHHLRLLLYCIRDEIEKLAPKRKLLCQKLMKLLGDIPFLDWDAEELLNFCVDDAGELLFFIEYRIHKSKKIRDIDKFEVIPSDGLRFIKLKITCFSDYLKLTEEIINWYKADIFCRNYAKSIMNSIAVLKDKETKEIYLIKCIENFLKRNLIKQALICAQFLPLTSETANIFMELGEIGIERNFYNEVKSLFFLKIFPEDKTKKIFLQMTDKTRSFRLKYLMKQCIQTIDKEMGNPLKRNEEIFYL